MNIGDKWNDWTVESFIGEGTYGKVYRIVRTEFNHTYESALKVISIPQNSSEIATIQSEGMDNDSITAYFKGMVEDIVSEFAIMSELKGNSNIVSYEDHSYEKRKESFGWDIYIRMEMLTPLFTYMREHTFTIRDAIQLGIDICKALEICQKYNIIHRDIKPENIFVSKLGAFKLGDFGIARRLENATAAMSKKGTYSYMAPEVYKGQPYNSSVDTYSLGIVLYRILNNNRLPFLPEYPNAISYSDRQKANVRRLSGEPMPDPYFAKGRLAEIILKACAYNPKERYESPRDMREALESILYSEEEGKIIYPRGDAVDAEQGDIESWSYTNSTIGLEEKYNIHDNVIDNRPAGIQGDAEKLVLDNLAVQDYETKTEDVTITDDASELSSGSALDSSGPLPNRQQSNEKTTPKPQPRRSGISKKALTAIIAATVAIALCCVGVYKYYHHTVPNVIGMYAKEAAASVNKAGLTYDTTKEFSDDVERGRVISQSDQGNSVKKGTKIHLTISSGVPVSTPNLTGLTEEEAIAIAEKAGVVVVLDGEELSENTPKGGVSSQTPEAGTEIEVESEIRVVMSKGLVQVKVPDAVGKTADEADKAFKEAGLKTSEISYEYSSTEAGLVISQSIDAGKEVDKHSAIDLVISAGAAPVQKSNNSGSSSNSKSKSNKKKSNKEAEWS